MADFEELVCLSFGLREGIKIETPPTEEQLRRLRDYIGSDVNVKRFFDFSIVDDDGDTLSGEKHENEVIRLKEVTESGISGIAHNKQTTMNFLENHFDPFIATGYCGLNHPSGLRSGHGERYIDEIKCGNELLYKVTIKRI